MSETTEVPEPYPPEPVGAASVTAADGAQDFDLENLDDQAIEIDAQISEAAVRGAS